MRFEPPVPSAVTVPSLCRMMVGAIIEASHDDNGIVWPEPVAPFEATVLNLKTGDGATDAACETLYRDLAAAGRDVLYDDRDERPGACRTAALPHGRQPLQGRYLRDRSFAHTVTEVWAPVRWRAVRGRG